MSARKRAAEVDDEDEVVLSDGDDDDEPAAQRARVAKEYPPGTVLKVRMENFMTYTDVTVEPGPRLNLILGPTGTGKSSLVCALCVGLAGATKLLGRAKELREYVKRGESSSTITITLSSGTETRPTTTTVYRRITTDNKSEWKINGAAVTLSKVTEVVAGLNIQLDNLCQFLPQDRVVAFAQMSPCELLLETEKAFGSRELHEQHTSLIAEKQSMKDLESTVAAHAAQLERLRGINSGLERDVKRFNARAELTAKADTMKKKLPWLLYEDARSKHEEAKEVLAAGKKSLVEKEAALEQFSKPIKAKEAALAKCSEEVKESMRQLSAWDTSINQNQSIIEEANEKMDSATSEITAAKRRGAQKATRIAKLERELEEARAEVTRIPAAANREAELGDIRARLRVETATLQRAETDVADAIDSVRLPQHELTQAQAKLRAHDDLKSSRIAMLRNIYASRGIEAAIAAVGRLRDAGKFQRDVFGPVLCEVAVKDKQHAAYLEQQCPKWVWSAFVTTCDADRDLIRSECKGLNVSVMNYTNDVSRPIANPVPASTLAQWGVTTTLDTVFDAPPAVKHALNDQGGLGKAYIGTTEADKNVDSILGPVPILWTPTNQYVITTSKYANARSTRMVPTRPSRFFTSSANPALRTQLMQRVQELTATIEEISVKGRKLERVKEEAAHTVDELNRRKEGVMKEQSQLDQRRRAANKTVNAKATALETERGAADVSAEVEKLEETIVRYNKRHIAATSKVTGFMLSITELMIKRAPQALQQAELREQVNVLKARLQAHSAELEHAKSNVEKLAAILADTRAKAKALHTEATRVAPMSDEQLKIFENLPSDVTELEDLIAATSAEADAILCPNPGVMQEYKQRAADIAELDKEHRDKAGQLATHQARLDATKAAWLPKLRELFGRVSKAFAEAFAGIGCAGEVRLFEAEDDYAAYAVNILVKFRAPEELRQLTASYQSGGERSVSTMLYLIALQDLTRCPFRVVDEINQGMDPKNERKIFQQMVKSATAPGTPQCFLLTPKLLPQLDYSKEVTVLCIFNGPWQAAVATNWRRELLLNGGGAGGGAGGSADAAHARTAVAC